MSSGSDDASDQRAVVLAVLADPDAGRARLPQLLGLLDAADRHTRISGAWAVSLVASECPDLAEPIARRLLDRVARDEHLEASQAIGFLHAWYPEVVEETAADVAEEADKQDKRRRLLELSRGFTRNEYTQRSESNRDVGRTRLPSEASSGNPRRIYREEGSSVGGAPTSPENREPEDGDGESTEDEADEPTAPDDVASADSEMAESDASAGGDGSESDADSVRATIDDVVADETGPVETGPSDPDEKTAAGSDAVATEDGPPDDDETAAIRPDADGEAGESAGDRDDTADIDATTDASTGTSALQAITAASRFDRLDIMDTATEGRYTDVYRTRAVSGNEETGVALRLFRTPDGEAADFATSLADPLHNWHAISDHDGVLTLYEWGTEPSPWMATEYTTETLYDREGMSLREAVWNARKIAETVSYAHQRGVVHAGIDPYDVVYQSPLTSVRREPLVTNFGLVDGMRTYFEPSSFLDPRYAAPEYFDSSFGDVDHTTDIYQVGAVLFRLFTGRAPFEGDYATVRRDVMHADPPAPSAVNADVPSWLDEVVRKALAKRKLTRYETATNLVGDLKRAEAE